MIPEKFTQRMQALLGPEYEAFAASYSRPRQTGLRHNPLKAASLPDLPEFGLSPVPWAENGYFYDPDTRPGLSPFHEAGLYYLQEPSAMAPAELLDVAPGMKVLDLCAAPGGKSTQIAAKLMGKGLLVSNEIVPGRAKILSRNMERCAVSNALVLNEHPKKLEDRFQSFFDRIMVDAPCSGEGMFRKEEDACRDWSEEVTQMCADRQLEILCSAAQMLAPGGKLVYSTCTFAPVENEGVISRFLHAHPDFSMVNPKNPHFSPGRPDWTDDPAEGLEYTCRLWPHKLGGEGHFAAVLQKCGGCAGGDACIAPKADPPKEFLDFVKDFSLPEGNFLSFGGRLYLAPKDLPDLKGLKVLRPGLELGQSLKNRFEPAHAWAIWLKNAPRSHDMTLDEALRYLHGQTVPGEETGWTVMTYRGLSLGWAKGSGGVLKNHFPKGLRWL